MSPDELRTRIADALHDRIDDRLVAEFICCDPVRPDHDLCTAADQARRMVAGLLADDPDRHPERSPVLDAVMGVVGPEVQYLREELTDVSARNSQLEEDAEKLGRRIDRVRFLHEADDADPDECNQCSTHAPCPTLKAIGDLT